MPANIARHLRDYQVLWCPTRLFALFCPVLEVTTFKDEYAYKCA